MWILITLNKNPISIEQFGDIDYFDLDRISVKNCYMDDYLDRSANRPIKDFLVKNSCLFQGKVLIDVKFHEFKKSAIPCIPGWHIDGSVLQGSKSIEQYLLYICGTVSFTEFCNDEFEVPCELKSVPSIKSFEAKSITKLKSGEMAKYDGTNMHRGSPSGSSGSRLLIRMMTSETITGLSYHNSIFRPTLISH